MTSALPVIGQAVGTYFGGPIGGVIGSAIGSALAGSKTTRNVQPGIDLRVPGTDYGDPIPRGRGAFRTAGDDWWHSEKRRIETTTSSGGKGGEPKVENTTAVYEMDWLVGLTDVEIVGVSRIWKNQDLVFTSSSGASSGSIVASGEVRHWTRMTVYTGASTQLPDPTYEAAVTTAKAIAYRGRGSVMVEGLQLGSSGQLVTLTFEVVIDGQEDTLITYYDGLSTTPTGEIPQAVFVQDRGEVWVTDQDYDTGTGADRIGIFNLQAQTWEYIILPSPYHQISNIKEAVLHVVPEWDRVYVNAKQPSGFHDCHIFSISTRQYIDSFHQILNVSQDAIIMGVDVVNSRMLLHETGIGLAIYGVIDGIPSAGIVTFGTVSLGDGSHAFASVAGAFYIVNANNIIKASLSGLEYIAPGADGANGLAWSSVYDASRDCVFFLSNLAPSGEHLKKLDCATDVITRVNSTAYATSGSFPSYGSWAMAPDIDRLISVKDSTTIYIVDPDDGSVETTYDISVGGGAHFEGGVSYSNGVLWSASQDNATGNVGLGEIIFAALTKTCPTVQDVQSEVCLGAGLSAGQIDVTPLSTITRTVCCLPITQIQPPRQTSALLADTYFYGVTASDKVKFVPRGGATVASIAYEELGASEGGDDETPFGLNENNEIEIPAWKVLKYINIDNDYQPGAETSDRLISASALTLETMQYDIGLAPAEAKGVVDTTLLDQSASRYSGEIRLLGDYPELEPTDTILVTDSDGSVYRLRIVERRDSYPLMTYQVVIDDTSVLIEQGITSTDYTSQTTVAASVATLVQYMDIPILQDADDDAGFYVAAKGAGTPYPGAAIFDSADNVEFARQATIAESAVFGTCTTALGNWHGPRVFDETNSVTVNVGDGTLTSSTRDAVLQSLAVNAILIGSELIQFVTATLVSPGVYTLTSLLRGGRGTEWAMTGHAIGDRCVLLRPQGLRRLVLTNSQLGAARYYKAVTLGRSLGTAAARVFTDTGVGLKPFSPLDGRVSRDGSNNATITWQRRSRLSVRMVGTMGISVPLGENVEAYEIDIITDASEATVLRTISASTPSATYSAADQTTDGLTPGNAFNFVVYQLSPIVGRGYPLEAYG